MSQPIRLPIIEEIELREPDQNKDGLSVNVFFDKSQTGTTYAVKRPGLVSYLSGQGSALGMFSGIAFFDATFNWASRTSGTSNDLTGVIYSTFNSKWYVVGTSVILTSSDGNTWSSETPGSGLWSGIAFSASDGIIVIVSNDSAIKTSTGDGTWTSRTSGTLESLNGIGYGVTPDLFVAVGDNGTILTSPTGTTWTSRTSGSTESLQKVAFSVTLGLFVIVGQNGTILTSSDGITWTSRTSGTSKHLYGIAFGNGYFVAVGYGTLGSGTIILRSTDGITWAIIEEGQLRNYENVTYGERFVIVGNANTSYYSFDGLTWTSSPTVSSSGTSYGVGYSAANTSYICCGYNGRLEEAEIVPSHTEL